MIIKIEKKIEIFVESFELGGHTIERYKSIYDVGGEVIIAPWTDENDNVGYLVYRTSTQQYHDLDKLMLKALTKRITDDLENLTTIYKVHDTIEAAREQTLRILNSCIILKITH